MNSTRRRVVAAIITLTAAVAGPLSAQAAAVPVQASPAQATASPAAPPRSTPPVPGPRIAPDAIADSDADAALRRLAGHQDPAEATRIMHDGFAAAGYGNPRTGQIVAAVHIVPRGAHAAPGASPLIHPLGPGCSTTSACLTRADGRHFGFEGWGTIVGSWPRTTEIYAGDRETDFFFSDGGSWGLVAGARMTFGETARVVKIRR